MPNLTLHHGTMHHTQGEGFVISAVQSPLCQPESLPSTIVRGLYIYNRRHPPACRALASHLQQRRCITTGPRIKFPRRTRIDGFARSATLGTHQPQKTCPTARRCLPAVHHPPPHSTPLPSPLHPESGIPAPYLHTAGAILPLVLGSPCRKFTAAAADPIPQYATNLLPLTALRALHSSPRCIPCYPPKQHHHRIRSCWCVEGAACLDALWTRVPVPARQVLNPSMELEGVARAYVFLQC
jgi:hypothetical protein